MQTFNISNFPKIITATCGHRLEYEDHILYLGCDTANGICYKDLDAWEKNEGVIYVSEYGLEEEKQNTWTREQLIDFLYDEVAKYGIGAENDAEFLASLGLDLLMLVDWQDLATAFEECNYNEDWVLESWEEWNNKK